MGQSHSAAQAFAQHTANNALARDADCFLASSVHSIYESALEVIEEVEEVSAVEAGRCGGTVPLNPRKVVPIMRDRVKNSPRPDRSRLPPGDSAFLLTRRWSGSPA